MGGVESDEGTGVPRIFPVGAQGEGVRDILGAEQGIEPSLGFFAL